MFGFLDCLVAFGCWLFCFSLYLRCGDVWFGGLFCLCVCVCDGLCEMWWMEEDVFGLGNGWVLCGLDLGVLFENAIKHQTTTTTFH